MTTPLVRLEIQEMRYQVLHALSLHHKEIEEQVAAAIDLELNSFDLKAVIKETVGRELRKAIVDAVSQATAQICWDKDIAALLKVGASKKVREAIEKALEA